MGAGLRLFLLTLVRGKEGATRAGMVGTLSLCLPRLLARQEDFQGLCSVFSVQMPWPCLALVSPQ